MILSQVGKQGQERLLAAKVLVVGLGGLGCPSALYLAAAGVGQLGVLDFDVVDASNLQRQVLYTTQDVGQPKASTAARRLRCLNPDVRITEYNQRLTADNAIQIISIHCRGKVNLPIFRDRPNDVSMIPRLKG